MEHLMAAIHSFILHFCITLFVWLFGKRLMYSWGRSSICPTVARLWFRLERTLIENMFVVCGVSRCLSGSHLWIRPSPFSRFYFLFACCNIKIFFCISLFIFFVYFFCFIFFVCFCIDYFFVSILLFLVLSVIWIWGYFGYFVLFFVFHLYFLVF